MYPTTPGAAWPTDPYAHTMLEARALRAGQRLTRAGAGASLALGLALLAWPGRTAPVVATILGAWLLATGVLRLAEAVSPGEVGGAFRALFAVGGLVYLVTGLVCVRGLVPTLAVLAVAVGLAWVAGGTTEIIAALTGGRAWSGAVSVGAAVALGGFALTFWPSVSLATLGWLAGAWLVGIGAVQVASAVRAARPTGP
jgi:uncharacterized membrane protein HdeD (DUF308 family)